MSHPVTLLILDGWGIGPENDANPLYTAGLKFIPFIRRNYLAGALQASGIAVGLPWGEEGNSEVGHLTLGSGRVIYQYYPRISMDIRNGSFFKKTELVAAGEHTKKNNSTLHILGLMTESNIHASLEHVRALIQFAKQAGVPRLLIHPFSDGKDSRPKSTLALLGKIQSYIEEAGMGAIASISGRAYALDRAGHWNRTQGVYDMLTGKGPFFDDMKTWVEQAYGDGLSDETITAGMLKSDENSIRSSDALFFFDFREDSIRQLAASFILKEFAHFPRVPLDNLYIATMTRYSDEFSDAHAMYPPEAVEACLGKALSDAGKAQIRVAETEKYAHVTFFFNGYRDEPFPSEFRVLVPSEKVAHVDQAPKMRAEEIGTRVVEAIEGGGFDFILANFANADMVAHAGNFDATIIGARSIDEQVGRIMEATFAREGILIITADHGHAEVMRDPATGHIENRHGESLVPFYLVGRPYQLEKSEVLAKESEHFAVGFLSDVAPTILELMDIPKPKEMTGKSLLRSLG